jgi:SAM-dependent methyltransferase
VKTISDYNAEDYEKRYQRGYGLLYPESHIIRVHRQIMEWELGIHEGNVFDFGCGTGANLKYFFEQGFIPYGCDTSETAIAACRRAMPNNADHFHVSEVHPNVQEMVGDEPLTLFLSNQVLYFLDDNSIRDVVSQACDLIRPGGLFIVTMMAYSCWYFRHVSAREGDFHRIDMDTSRQKLTTLINFKDRAELEPLFSPFRKLHLGAYSNWIREDEGPTDHWLYVGVRD